MMYELERSVTLVTAASELNQNLALYIDELIGADTIASVHEGYISVVPLINHNRRCRYVSIYKGKERGQGNVKQIKWLKFDNEYFFFIASTSGLQVYDVEVYSLTFNCPCENFNTFPDYISGLCAVEDNILCVGTNFGTIFLLKYTNHGTFRIIQYFQAHEDDVILLDGIGKYLISSSKNSTYLWVKDKQFTISRQIFVEGLLSTPTVLKMTKMLIFVGYESGEFCVFDIFDSGFIRRAVAHKLKISGIDFCVLGQLILTCSEDSYIKLWRFHRDVSEIPCAYSVTNQNGPLCGVGFLDDLGIQFCTVSANSIKVNIYSRATIKFK